MKDPIHEMDSEEFIAHIFYNVLGGLYAASEEDARQGILDMLKDRLDAAKGGGDE